MPRSKWESVLQARAILMTRVQQALWPSTPGITLVAAVPVQLLHVHQHTFNMGCAACLLTLQVDVRALKDLLWDSLVTVNQQAASEPDQDSAADSCQQSAAAAAAQPSIDFQDVIVSVPEQSDAGSLSDVSVHMCFICLLHLANEKGLVIKAKEDLKTLTIGNVETATG